jgi:cyclophilin family peptidyl-prolyl cis-trans isomerase
MPAYIAPEIQNEDVIASIKTNKGIIKIKLFTDKTPITTTNFIGLSQK